MRRGLEWDTAVGSNVDGQICDNCRLCRSHTQTRATAAAVGAARPFEEAAMEHGTVEDSSASTFSIAEEEHTLANPARFVLNQE
ncbi:Os11g0218200 [Oryza sativa Japonica Group]|uniref:Os11g0218200 protein n=1 Tax=Oryza sativa subsp. japonica TaxID=39947 RepID=A0A0P0Y0H6_ORYSJ|nr:hypothetical protein EE612_054247 [Oryza sativa]BAT13230.1 Os11g0218200 [Oryza sativa Japonica Group]